MLRVSLVFGFSILTWRWSCVCHGKILKHCGSTPAMSLLLFVQEPLQERKLVRGLPLYGKSQAVRQFPKLPVDEHGYLCL